MRRPTVSVDPLGTAAVSVDPLGTAAASVGPSGPAERSELKNVSVSFADQSVPRGWTYRLRFPQIPVLDVF